MPKLQEKSNVADQASNAKSARASTGGQAINELKTDIKKGTEGVKSEIVGLRQEINGKLDKLATEVQGLSDRVEETETCVGQMEDWAEDATRTLLTCLEQQRYLQQKVIDLESRSRRNNVRVFGVAEGEEGDSMMQFIVNIIKSAHPRPIIVNFQEFSTKEMVLREAWKKGKILVGNRALHFDHDYASEIVKKRKEYNDIKKALKESGIHFQTPYTRMRIHWDSGVHTYNSAQEARRDLKKRGFQIEDPVATEGDGILEKQLAERLGCGGIRIWVVSCTA
ncbi:LINE-1 retrotransposable element ORF1 protein [Collichthys lucidus]|uniref:LINE-1 retrotransposable element ORF1 protein n=1 Tax=Collichthys lucidus TaxID=240159 RepID=A0A4V6ALV2_COLLU|nr:LINE-1 retrotransposable element ORF1 protein [Collichthys lucidus]